MFTMPVLFQGQIESQTQEHKVFQADQQCFRIIDRGPIVHLAVIEKEKENQMHQVQDSNLLVQC